MSEYSITSIDRLEQLFGKASERSIVKETDHLTDAYRAWLEQASFFSIASHSAETGNEFQNIDCSPRGDLPGSLLKVLDNRTILIPDRKGNNRIDTLRNIISKPDVALLFMIPGISEALRIKGTATISNDPALCALFDGDTKPAIVVIEVAIRSVYFQCSRAAMRSGIWNAASFRERTELPSPGEMLSAAGANLDAKSYDADLAERLKEL